MNHLRDDFMGPTCLYEVMNKRLNKNPFILGRNIRRGRKVQTEKAFVEAMGSIPVDLSMIGTAIGFSVVILVKERRGSDESAKFHILDSKTYEIPHNHPQFSFHHRFPITKGTIANTFSLCMFLILTYTIPPTTNIFEQHQKYITGSLTNIFAGETFHEFATREFVIMKVPYLSALFDLDYQLFQLRKKYHLNKRRQGRTNYYKQISNYPLKSFMYPMHVHTVTLPSACVGSNSSSSSSSSAYVDPATLTWTTVENQGWFHSSLHLTNRLRCHLLNPPHTEHAILLERQRKQAEEQPQLLPTTLMSASKKKKKAKAAAAAAAGSLPLLMTPVTAAPSITTTPNINNNNNNNGITAVAVLPTPASATKINAGSTTAAASTTVDGSGNGDLTTTTEQQEELEKRPTISHAFTMTVIVSIQPKYDLQHPPPPSPQSQLTYAYRPPSFLQHGIKAITGSSSGSSHNSISATATVAVKVANGIGQQANGSSKTTATGNEEEEVEAMVDDFDTVMAKAGVTLPIDEQKEEIDNDNNNNSTIALPRASKARSCKLTDQGIYAFDNLLLINQIRSTINLTDNVMTMATAGGTSSSRRATSYTRLIQTKLHYHYCSTTHSNNNSNNNNKQSFLLDETLPGLLCPWCQEDIPSHRYYQPILIREMTMQPLTVTMFGLYQLLYHLRHYHDHFSYEVAIDGGCFSTGDIHIIVQRKPILSTTVVTTAGITVKEEESRLRLEEKESNEMQVMMDVVEERSIVKNNSSVNQAAPIPPSIILSARSTSSGSHSSSTTSIDNSSSSSSSNRKNNPHKLSMMKGAGSVGTAVVNNSSSSSRCFTWSRKFANSVGRKYVEEILDDKLEVSYFPAALKKKLLLQEQQQQSTKGKGGGAGKEDEEDDENSEMEDSKKPIDYENNSDLEDLLYHGKRKKKVISAHMAKANNSNNNNNKSNKKSGGIKRTYGRLATTTYFHAQTGQPLLEDEINYDSDQEVDPTFELTRTNQAIDEYTDITLQEKEFMKLWNCHILTFPPYGDRLLPLVCNNFIQKYCPVIVDKNLRHNALLHFLAMHDFGLLLSEEVAEYMTILDEYAKRTKAGI